MTPEAQLDSSSMYLAYLAIGVEPGPRLAARPLGRAAGCLQHTYPAEELQVRGPRFDNLVEAVQAC